MSTQTQRHTPGGRKTRSSAPKRAECSYCGRELEGEEIESPSKDDRGDLMCDDCYDEHFRDYCGRCDEKVEKVDLDCSPGQLIGIWDDAAGLPAGYYRVKSWPFYANGMITGFFFKHALEFAFPLDAAGKRRAEEGGYLSGPMCSDCRSALKATGAQS